MTPKDPAQLTIDIWSDVMCPWCLIGWGNLRQALDALDGEIDAEVRWHAFELNPDMPPEGEEQVAHIARKYGRTVEQAQAVRGQLRAAADAAQVSLDYDGPEPAPPAMMRNTFLAHKLLLRAGETAGPERQTALKLVLFRSHFNERHDVGNRAVLLDIAEEQGFDRAATEAALDDEALGQRVRGEERAAWDLNISGVPAMVIGGKFMVSGAQAADTYVDVLRKVADKIAA
jgi:predicted DsbA family dithiol-disulfide isomerase